MSLTYVYCIRVFSSSDHPNLGRSAELNTGAHVQVTEVREQELDRLSVTALILLAWFAQMESYTIDSKACYAYIYRCVY